MTTAPTGRRIAWGLTAAIATVFAMLALGPPAAAAEASHTQQVRHAAGKRSLRYERYILRVRQPARGEKARKPAKAAPRRWAIDIPSIGVAAGLMTLGGPTGEASDPFLPTPPLAEAASKAGWYQFSAVPGAAGNAVIAGHVDTYVGPGVFYNLYQLLPGDMIYVKARGAWQRFKVTSDREFPKSSFPVNQVFGGTKKHMLWLITCGGDFDYATRHYLDNILVSASWVPPNGKH